MAARVPALARVVRFVLPLAVVTVIWQAVVSLGFVDSSLVPSPVQIARSAAALLYPRPLLFQYLAVSLWRVGAGFALGSLIGVSLGVLMGSSSSVRFALKPLLDLLIAVPTICWVPLLLVTVGMGDPTIIIAVFLGCVFPVTYTSMNGARAVPRDVVLAANAMGAGRAAVVLLVLVPGALPSIITGLRLAVGYSWRALVGAEMLAAAASGIGYMIYAARAFYDVNVMFVGLAIISVAGLAMDYMILGAAERRTVQRWGMVTKTW